jgi:hypothetical protein
VAASEFHVVSPLSGLAKQEVRDVAKYLGLPNWNAAASPCLRSRLQFGVEATQVRKLCWGCLGLLTRSDVVTLHSNTCNVWRGRRTLCESWSNWSRR